MADYVALAHSREEFDAINRFAAGKPDSKVMCIYQEYWFEGVAAKNVELQRADRVISEKELDEVDEKALFFARNWHKFGRQFEESVTVDGIQLGYVSEVAIFNIFKKIFLFLKSASKAAGMKKVPGLVAVQGTISGDCAKIVAEHLNLEYAELMPLDAKQPVNKPLIVLEKMLEVGKKISQIALDACAGGRGKGRTRVFVKGNRYLGGLVEEMQKHSELEIISLDNLLVKKLLNPFNAWRFRSVVSNRKKFFVNIFEKYRASKAFSENMFFGGIFFGNAFAARMPRFTERDWPEFVFAIDVLREEFERRQPKVVVLWEDCIPVERICALLARRFGVKSLVTQHGLLEPDTNLPDWIGSFAPLTADKIAVWGGWFRKLLLERGVAPSRAVVTGAPRFDALHRRRFQPEGVKARLGIGREKLIVIGSGRDLRTNELEMILGCIKTLPKEFSARVVVKIHPNESIEWYNWVEGKAIVLKKADLYELLSAADAVIVKQSTVGLEAMILNKPVIVFSQYAERNNPFKATDAVLRAGNSEELSASLQVALDAAKRKSLEGKIKRFVFERAFKQDGKASGRLIELVKSMAMQSKKQAAD